MGEDVKRAQELTKEDLKYIRRIIREGEIMVAKKRIPKKKLKEPDEFITWGSRLMNYILSHVRYIGLGILLLGVIILVLILWRQHMIASDERAFGLLGKGIHLYHQGEKKEEAVQVFTELIEHYPRNKAGKVALLYRGRCYMLQKQYDLAMADFNLFLKKSSDLFLRTIALNALGNSYRAKGEYQRAIEHFQQVLSSGEEWLKPFVLFHMGMCWEKLEEQKRASDAYHEALKLSPPTPWANMMRMRLKKLGGKAH